MAEEGMDYPFHLGVTEAGEGEDGRIKSAVGIGSLLEDGIGDTIRVSLTEEPEMEIPVARRIAEPFNTPFPARDWPAEGERGAGFRHVENFYHYERRSAREIDVGPVRMGGRQPVRVVLDLPGGLPPERLLATLEKQLKSSKGNPPEIMEWRPDRHGGGRALAAFRGALRAETGRIAFLARLSPEGCEDPDLTNAADAVLFPFHDPHRDMGPLRWLAPAAKAAGKPLFVESRRAEVLLEALSAVAPLSSDLVATLAVQDPSLLLREWRWVAAQPWVKEAGIPFHLRAPAQGSTDHLLSASRFLGGLLSDGIGDSVQLGLGRDPEADLKLAYNVLQGAGVRITKAEFVSCPGCGRTLFDLQSTTESIKARTGHLKNVKIAVMGCIVNGPGEMADADFGYVGGGPDRINLYVGKECVEKGIPSAEAGDRLVELIRRHGKWTDPPPDGSSSP
jgi:(E)-4-hydroxy-3-methylbut-2-enyl-diphosphate synthase